MKRNKRVKRVPIKIHPGEYLRDELKARGWQQKYLSKITGISRPCLSGLINGRKDINAKVAVLLEKAFGSSAETWMRLQNDYDIKKVIDRLGRQHVSPDPQKKE